MSVPGITGFRAVMEVDDDGDGSAPGGDSEPFDGLTTFALPAVEAVTFERGELNPASAFEVQLPTGVLKLGPAKAEMQFSKGNYQRLNALAGKRGYTFTLVSPDDLTASPGPTKLTVTFVGFVSKVDEVKYEKLNQAVIPFEVTVSAAPTLT